jgi:hypothetical protein
LHEKREAQGEYARAGTVSSGVLAKRTQNVLDPHTVAEIRIDETRLAP